mgnify:CR=1 FL=1
MKFNGKHLSLEDRKTIENMKDLTQDKINLMFSHINSVPRKSLGGKTPYEAFEFFYGEETLDKLSIQKINKYPPA